MKGEGKAFVLEHVCKYIRFGQHEFVFETSLYVSNLIALGEIKDFDVISEGQRVFDLQIMQNTVPVGIDFLLAAMPYFPGVASVLSAIEEIDFERGIVDIVGHLFCNDGVFGAKIGNTYEPRPLDYTSVQLQTFVS